MKVVLVSHSQKAGGAEKCLLEAAVGLQREGFEVVVLVPKPGELSEALERVSVKFQIVSYPWWVHFKHCPPNLLQRAKRVGSTAWYAVKLWRVFRQIDPDVVISNTLCVGAAAVAARVLNKRHIWFIHEYGEEDHGLLFDLGFYLSSKVMSLTARQILVNSMAVRSKFSKHISVHKFSIVSYDIPVPKADRRFDMTAGMGGDVNLLLVGQVSSNKGQMDAVKALRILLEKGYRAKLHIIGQVSEEVYFMSLQKYIDENGLEANVVYTSHVENPYSAIPDFAIGLMCSQWEALGRVTIEYMKLEIPVIGADSGTTSTLINHGHNGLLYKLRDPASLAAQIQYILANKDKCSQIVSNAKTFASVSFNSERFVNGIVSSLIPTHG